MAEFVPGLPLSHDYFEHVVAPIVADILPGIPYAAALVGDGSEVQGFDTARSMDHDWGPRVQLFFDPDHIAHARELLTLKLAARLPHEFGGHSTQYHRGDTSQPSGPWRWGEIIRGVEIHEPGHWALTYLGVDPRRGLTVGDWLAMPWTLLRGVTGGAIWRDDSGGLSRVRAAVRWYSTDLWRYVVASQWQRIDEEEPFVGRTSEVNAEVGSRIVAVRQLREIMHLCFLLERQYPPYSKWLETGFARLGVGGSLLPLMLEVTAAPDFRAREHALGQIYERVATLHNASNLSAPVDPRLQHFHDRPFRVLNSHRFVAATLAAIEDSRLRSMPLHGCISQCVDCTAVLSSGGASHRFGTVLGRGDLRQAGTFGTKTPPADGG
jgi:hypothetical protein